MCVCVCVSRSVDPAVAGKAFRKLRCVLADAAAVAPDRLANELYSDSIISRATLRLVLENSPASIVKMLDDVEGWLERDGRHFSRLLTVFKNSSALTIDFAARLVHNYRECELNVARRLLTWQFTLCLVSFFHSAVNSVVVCFSSHTWLCSFIRVLPLTHYLSTVYNYTQCHVLHLAFGFSQI